MSDSPAGWQPYAAARGSTLHYATLFLAPVERRRLLALYGIAGQIAMVVDECSDPGVARTKLRWWIEELDCLAAGRPRHPLGHALGPLPAAALLPWCAAAQEELQHGGFADETQLERHCRAYGQVQRTAATLLGADDAALLDQSAELGQWLARAEVLAGSGRRLHRGHSPLPRDLLDAAGVEDRSLAGMVRSATVRELCADMLEDCLAGLQRMPRLPSRLHPLAIQARIIAARLQEIRRDGCRVLERHVDITPLRRLWLALRTYYGSRLGAG